MSVNKVIMICRLGKDPEPCNMTSGEAVTNCTLSISKNLKDKNGEKQEQIEWHRQDDFGVQHGTTRAIAQA